MFSTDDDDDNTLDSSTTTTTTTATTTSTCCGNHNLKNPFQKEMFDKYLERFDTSLNNDFDDLTLSCDSDDVNNGDVDMTLSCSDDVDDGDVGSTYDGVNNDIGDLTVPCDDDTVDSVCCDLTYLASTLEDDIEGKKQSEIIKREEDDDRFSSVDNNESDGDDDESESENEIEFFFENNCDQHSRNDNSVIQSKMSDHLQIDQPTRTDPINAFLVTINIDSTNHPRTIGLDINQPTLSDSMIISPNTTTSKHLVAKTINDCINQKLFIDADTNKTNNIDAHHHDSAELQSALHPQNRNLSPCKKIYLNDDNGERSVFVHRHDSTELQIADSSFPSSIATYTSSTLKDNTNIDDVTKEAKDDICDFGAMKLCTRSIPINNNNSNSLSVSYQFTFKITSGIKVKFQDSKKIQDIDSTYKSIITVQGN